MPLSCIVVDPRKAWLELQAELGGNEVIFDEPISVQSYNTDKGLPADSANHKKMSKKSPIRDGQESTVKPAARDRKVTRYAPGEEPKWLIDAPPIPADGLVIDFVRTKSAMAPDELTLDAIAAKVVECTNCPLCKGRTNAVPGEGNPNADLMVVGEGPGAQEDETGRPFVGRAGKVLDKMLMAIGLEREAVFIANVVKCRPPKNRAPLPDERAACLPYLQQQIRLVKPKAILALGGTASEALLGVKGPLSSVRTRVHHLDGVPLVVTYHPAALLRNPNWKRPAWDDVRIARQLLDLDD